MRVLLLGANGQLGTDLVSALADVVDLRAVGHGDIEIADPSSVERGLRLHEPDLVVNTAAYNRVDEAEEHPELALRTNTIGPHILAKACAARGVSLLHTSTDYVFSGDTSVAWTETDQALPINAYGISKLAGEHAVRAACPRSYVVRVSGLFGLRGTRGKATGPNFVETMLRLQRDGRSIKVVDDQTLAPTYTADLARKMRELILAGDAPFGVYHMTASGACSWFEFARAIFKIADLDVDLTPQRTTDAGSQARRPRNSVLANTMLAAAGIEQIRPWFEGLQDYLAERFATTINLTGDFQAAPGPVSRH